MDMDTPDPSGAPPRPLVSEASLLYTTAAEVLAHMLRELQRGELDEAKKVPGYARELRQALQAVLTERTTLERLRKDEAGGAGPGALDFDAARAEIGRRLACLRDAGDC
ncbi:hypothetical protein [Acidimangrovimonas sediminis]|uniref:hypothetical protein n=1 Tax=Acidimangrovimonas sediminis TaxID=2056283 RepID=UPI000C80F5BD|nr:hypothetical protein [Acidimangrovimonas sediminis]